MHQHSTSRSQWASDKCGMTEKLDRICSEYEVSALELACQNLMQLGRLCKHRFLCYRPSF